MELALFPVAAILLLLSGAVAPAHLNAGAASPAALMRRLFTPGASHSATSDPQRATLVSPKAAHHAHHLPAAYAETHRRLTSHVRSASTTAARPVYRTRFGVRSRAYHATAPPLA